MRSFFIVEKTCYRRREESATVLHFFLTNHWNQAPEITAADLVVFFGCSGLRFLSEEKMNEIDQIRSQMKPGASLIVGGCLPEMETERLRNRLNVQTITPTDFSALNSLPEIEIPVEALPPVWGPESSCRELPKPSFSALMRMAANDAALSFCRLIVRRRPSQKLKQLVIKLQRRNTVGLTIAAGCARRCTYCAKPFASGQVRSKPIRAIVERIQQGVRYGYRGFDLYADSIGNYGIDQKVNLGGLLEQILALNERFTIGLFDVHPMDFVRYFDLIKRLCEEGKLHYIYVSVQSGNARVLKVMKRPIDINNLAEKLVEIRKFGDVFMQSGVIAGFPGETDEEFDETLQFLRRVDFDNVYVHYYCDMPNTEATAMTNKVDKESMKRRFEKVMNAGIRHNPAATLHEWEVNLQLPVHQPELLWPTVTAESAR